MHAGPQIDPKSVASLPLSMYAYAEPTGVGTGFVVLSDGVHLLLTNFHVLSGRHPDTLEQLPDVTAIPDRILLPVLVRGPRLVWRALVQQVLRDGEPLWVEHPNFGARFDVVALPLSLPGDTYVAHYSRDPGPKIAVTPASQVAIVGFPEGLSGAGITALWKSGAVASEVDPPLEAQEYFLIDANTRRGMSGSPVLARRDGTARMESGDTALHTNVVDRVLGVYAGRAFEAPDMTLGRVWKWSGVQELVDAAVLKVKSHALEPMRCYLGHHRAGGEDMVRLDLKKSVELTLRVGPAGTPQKRTFTVLELLRDIALMDDRFGRDLGRLRMAAAIEAACVSASADAGIVELSNEQHAVVREAIESPSKGYNPEAGRQLIPLIEYVLAPPQQSG